MEKSKSQIVIVKALIVDKGKVLFVRRNRPWHKEAHGKWEFAGGKIEFSEKPIDTAVREAKEETGYDVKVISLLPDVLSATWDYGDRLSQQILICYICKKVGGSPELKDHGVSELKWVDLNSPDVPIKEDCLSGTIEFLNSYKRLKC